MKPFFDEERTQILHGLNLDATQESIIIHNRDGNREELLRTMDFKRQIAAEKDEYVLDVWKRTINRNMLQVQEEVRVEKEVRDRKEVVLGRIYERHWNDM